MWHSINISNKIGINYNMNYCMNLTIPHTIIQAKLQLSPRKANVTWDEMDDYAIKINFLNRCQPAYTLTIGPET